MIDLTFILLVVTITNLILTAGVLYVMFKIKEQIDAIKDALSKSGLINGILSFLQPFIGPFLGSFANLVKTPTGQVKSP